MNRPFFYKAVVFVILFGTAIMWGIGGLFWFNYLIDTQKYNRMMAGMFDQVIDYKGAHGRSVPKPLVISEETALISSGTKADAVAKISNPNANGALRNWNINSRSTERPAQWKNLDFTE